MLDLNDPRWKTFKGGYQVLYDASIPLKALERSEDPVQIKQIVKDFWKELYHQGDVNIASYMALPHLIRIAKEKKLRDWDIPALVAAIEVARHTNNDPIPKEFHAEYELEIKDIIEVVKLNQQTKWDRIYAVCATAAIAAVNGEIDLARVIIELEDEELANKFESFMEHYDEFEKWLAEGQ